jgi:hypothetical protein
MAAVMAFQNAGRKRAQTIEDSEYERERKKERERNNLCNSGSRRKPPGGEQMGRLEQEILMVRIDICSVYILLLGVAYNSLQLSWTR